MNASALRRPAVSISSTNSGGLDLNRLAQRAMQPWSDAFEAWRAGVGELLAPPRQSARACGCGADHDTHHGCDACACCIVDADLVVETQVGERRIVSLVIENPWRRERAIELELSDWTTAPGVTVAATLLTPANLTLAPCAEAKVIIGLTIAAQGQTAAAAEGKPRGRTEGGAPTTEPPDVESCAVSYADLRIKGCDMRSIRIATAVLPRSCRAHSIDCGCGCCR